MNNIEPQPESRTLADGNEYTFSPMMVDDWCAFAAWVNKQTENKVTRIVPNDEMMQALESMQAMAWVAHRSVSRLHTVSAEDFRKILSMGDMMWVVRTMTHVPVSDEEVGSDPLPAQLGLSTG